MLRLPSSYIFKVSLSVFVLIHSTGTLVYAKNSERKQSFWAEYFRDVSYDANLVQSQESLDVLTSKLSALASLYKRVQHWQTRISDAYLEKDGINLIKKYEDQLTIVSRESNSLLSEAVQSWKKAINDYSNFKYKRSNGTEDSHDATLFQNLKYQLSSSRDQIYKYILSFYFQRVTFPDWVNSVDILLEKNAGYSAIQWILDLYHPELTKSYLEKNYFGKTVSDKELNEMLPEVVSFPAVFNVDIKNSYSDKQLDDILFSKLEKFFRGLLYNRLRDNFIPRRTDDAIDVNNRFLEFFTGNSENNSVVKAYQMSVLVDALALRKTIDEKEFFSTSSANTSYKPTKLWTILTTLMKMTNTAIDALVMKQINSLNIEKLTRNISDHHLTANGSLSTIIKDKAASAIKVQTSNSKMLLDFLTVYNENIKKRLRVNEDAFINLIDLLDIYKFENTSDGEEHLRQLVNKYSLKESDGSFDPSCIL